MTFAELYSEWAEAGPDVLDTVPALELGDHLAYATAACTALSAAAHRFITDVADALAERWDAVAP